ncbi:MAG: ferric reductase-like transmembrane domain-containing protein [Candidatus Dormibacteraeota bacterium]|nr:ferric reductase-like transmembrane domain-containing protein [Candidatus Dormibacteraeota bacterium]
MDPGLVLWVVARVAGLTAYAVLASAVVTGLALRTSIFQSLTTNRALREVHTFATVLWIPLAVAHAGSLLLDQTARLSWTQLLIPFSSAYASIGLGCGALSLDLAVLVIAAGLLRQRFARRLWLWVHRLAYAAFAAAFVHSLVIGTDVAEVGISALVCAVAGGVGLLALSRVVWGRLIT